MSIEPSVKHICQKCAEETEHGTFYKFYYGTTFFREELAYIRGEKMKVKKKYYKLEEPEEHFFCHRCIIQKDATFERNYGVFVLLAFTIMTMPVIYFLRRGLINWVTIGLIIFFTLFFIIGLYLLYDALLRAQTASSDDEDAIEILYKKGSLIGHINSVFAALQEGSGKLPILVMDYEHFGDTMAIEERKPELKKQGFDQFFTRAKHDFHLGEAILTDKPT